MYKFPEVKLRPRDKKLYKVGENIYEILYKKGVAPREMLNISSMLAEAALNDDTTLLRGNMGKVKNGNYKCCYCNNECSPHMYFLAEVKYVYFKDYLTF